MVETELTLIPQSLLAEARRIELRTRREMSADLMGSYRSAFRGSGLVCTDIREYAPGDDVKHIHWRITARSSNGNAYVKWYEEDRQLEILLAVDVSRSTAFGGGRSKRARMLEFAALVTMLARGSSDAIGLCSFSNGIEDLMLPGKKRSQFQRILRSLLAERTLRPETEISSTLRTIREKLRRPSVVFLVSDFYAPAFDDELRLLALRHDVVCVLVEHELESAPPSAGLVEFVEAEGGGRTVIDTSSPSVRAFLMRHAETRARSLRERVRRAGADLIVVRENPVKPLAELMNARRARFR